MTQVYRPQASVRPSRIDTANSQVSVLTIALIVLVVVAVAFPSLFYPFGRDQGIHAYIAKLAGDGLVVYRDIFNVKPPMTTVIHRLAQVFFGETMRAIRLMDIVIIATTAILLQHLVVRALRSYWLGFVAALAYAAYHFSNGYWFSAQTDGWCGLFMTAAVVAYSHALDAGPARRRLCLFVLAGTAVGLSFWTKYTTGLIVVVFVAGHLAHGYDTRRILVDGAAVTAGLVACIGGGLAILAAQGALLPFLEIQDFMRAYVAHSRSLADILTSPLHALVGAKGAMVFAMLGIYVAYKTIVSRRYLPECVGLLAWLGAGTASGLLQGKVIPYHMLPMQPPLAILTAIGVGALARWTAERTRRGAFPSVALIACVLIVGWSEIPKKYGEVLPHLRGEQTLRAFYGSEQFSHSDFNTVANLALVDYLKEKTQPSDKVFLWGFEPAVYFLSDRNPVTRFIYNFPMFTAYYRQSYRDEFMAGIRATPPQVFIVEHNDRMPDFAAHDHDSAEVLEAFATLRAFMARNYVLCDRVSRFDVYFRNTVETGTCPAR